MTVDRIGPEVVDTRLVDLTRESQQSHLDLTLTPAPLPRWSLFLGAQALPGVQPVLGLGFRVIGPVWAEAQLRQPVALEPPAMTLGVRVTW